MACRSFRNSWPIHGSVRATFKAFVACHYCSKLMNIIVVLFKKSQGMAYHFVREGCARDEWRTAYVNTHCNPADLLTKPLPSSDKRESFVKMILHHIFREKKRKRITNSPHLE